MAQFARPSSDVTVGSWTSTGANLYSVLDEVSASDSDYITAGSSATACEVALSSVTDPLSSTGHTLRVRAQATGSGGPERITIELYEGATLRVTAYSNQAVTRGSFNAYDWTLTGTEADSITDYTDLRVRLTPSVAGGESIDVSWVELEVPDASAPVSGDADDAVTLSDATSTAISYQQSSSDSLVINDAAGNVIVSPQSSSDSLAINDATSNVIVSPQSSSDSLAISDAASAAVVQAKGIITQLSPTATPGQTYSFTTKPVAGSVTGDVDDSLSLTDATSNVVSSPQSASDSLSLTDATSNVVSSPQSASDSLSLTDATSNVVSSPQSASDSLSLTDATSNIVASPQSASDDLSLTDSASATLVALASVSDSLSLTDSVSGETDGTASVSDTLGIIDEAVATLVSLASVDDAFTITDTTTGIAQSAFNASWASNATMISGVIAT